MQILSVLSQVQWQPPLQAAGEGEGGDRHVQCTNNNSHHATSAPCVKVKRWPTPSNLSVATTHNSRQLQPSTHAANNTVHSGDWDTNKRLFTDNPALQNKGNIVSTISIMYTNWDAFFLQRHNSLNTLQCFLLHYHITNVKERGFWICPILAPYYAHTIPLPSYSANSKEYNIDCTIILTDFMAGHRHEK